MDLEMIDLKISRFLSIYGKISGQQVQALCELSRHQTRRLLKKKVRSGDLGTVDLEGVTYWVSIGPGYSTAPKDAATVLTRATELVLRLDKAFQATKQGVSFLDSTDSMDHIVGGALAMAHAGLRVGSESQKISARRLIVHVKETSNHIKAFSKDLERCQRMAEEGLELDVHCMYTEEILFSLWEQVKALMRFWGSEAIREQLLLIEGKIKELLEPLT